MEDPFSSLLTNTKIEEKEVTISYVVDDSAEENVKNHAGLIPLIIEEGIIKKKPNKQKD